MSPPRNDASIPWRRLVCLAWLLSQAGCQSLSPWGSRDRDYEVAKKSIDGQYGDGVYRPEGASAESPESWQFLKTVGLQRQSRKDIAAAREAYGLGEEAFNAAKQLEGAKRRDGFRAASNHYKKAAENWRSSQLEQDALMMQAESLFFAEDYYKAEQVYARLIKEYPRNPYLDQIDSRKFEIGDYWLKTQAAKPRSFAAVNFTDNKLPWSDTGGHGKRVLENLRLDNPLGKLSDDATMRLAINYFEKGDYESAAATFGELRMTYPDSDHQFAAQFLELQSLLASYLGPQYTEAPLLEAEKRVKAIVRLFPSEAASKQLELREAVAQIKFWKAEREWENALYRFRQGENLAARMYLQQIIDLYPDTPFGEPAKLQLQELADKPDRPAQRFAPLVKLFGAETEERPWRKADSDQQP